MKFEGFLALYREAREEGDGKALEDEQALPVVDVGETDPVKEITPTQHFTEPPPRFSEASLVKELERLGIGRPSTYASIISVLADRRYVLLEQRRFFPTELGETVEKVMVKQFPDIFNVDFTSEMEGELDKVEDGDARLAATCSRISRSVRGRARRRRTSRRSSPRRTISRVLATEHCPDCGGKLDADGRILRAVPRLRESSQDVQVHAPAQGRERKPRDDRPSLPRVRQADGHSPGTQRRVPRLQQLPEVPRHALDADGRQVPEGRRRHRRAPLEEARQGVLRLRESSDVRLRRVEQAGCSRTCPECGFVGAEMKSTKARGDFRSA